MYKHNYIKYKIKIIIIIIIYSRRNSFHNKEKENGWMDGWMDGQMEEKNFDWSTTEEAERNDYM